MRMRSLTRAAALAAALLTLAGCGDEEPSTARPAPTATPDPAAEQARVTAQAQTRCANEAPKREAPPSEVGAYAREGLARTTAVVALLKAVPAQGPDRQRLETLLSAYGSLERMQREVLMSRPRSKAAARNRRAAAGAARDLEKGLQRQAESLGLGECGPLVSS